GRSQRKVGDAACFVDGNFAPGIHAADVGPSVLRPSVVSEFARMRNGVEGPNQFSGVDVVGAKIAGSRAIILSGRGSEDHQVFENASRRSALNVPRPRDAVTKIYFAVF